MSASGGETGPPDGDAVDLLDRRLQEFSATLEIPERVLVVDDEWMILDLVSNFLAIEEIHADVAATGEEALERMEAQAYAVVLTDKNMPGMDGIELLRRIKERWSRTEVLVLTGYGSVSTALEALDAGAFDYLLKPFPHISYVVERVRAAQARYAFETGFEATVQFLTRSLRDEARGDEQDHAERLRRILAAYEHEKQVHVVVHGTAPLADVVEGEGHRVTRVDSLDGAMAVAREVPVHLLLYVEPKGGPDGAEAIRHLRALRPHVGVLVVAHKRDLRSIVDAIGAGVGDYLLPDMEDRAILLARLRRLVARQRRAERCTNLLDSLRQLNVDVLG